MSYTVFVTIFFSGYVMDTKVRLGILWWLNFNCFDPPGFFGQVLFKMIIFHVISFCLMSTSPSLINTCYHGYQLDVSADVPSLC